MGYKIVESCIIHTGNNTVFGTMGKILSCGAGHRKILYCNGLNKKWRNHTAPVSPDAKCEVNSFIRTFITMRSWQSATLRTHYTANKVDAPGKTMSITLGSPLFSQEWRVMHPIFTGCITFIYCIT